MNYIALYFFNVMQHILKRALLVGLLLLLIYPALAQGQRSPRLRDSASISRYLTKRMQDTSITKVSDTSVAVVISRIEGYMLMLNQMMSTLKRGADTGRISQAMPSVDSSLFIIKRNIARLGSTPNVHDLYTNKVMLVQLERRLQDWQDDLFRRYDEQVYISDTIRQIVKDTAIRAVPAEDELQTFYVSQLTHLILKWQQVDSANRKNLLALGLIQNQVATRYIDVSNLLEEMEFRLTNFSNHMFDRDYTYLWEYGKHRNDPGYIRVLKNSVYKNLQVLAIFFATQWPVFIIWVLVAGLFTLWVFHNINRIRRQHPETEAEAILQHSRLLYRSPAACIVIFIFTLAVLLSVQYPILFTELNIGITVIATTYIFWRTLPKHLFRLWLMLVGLLVLYSLNNLQIQATYAEQWGLVAGAVVCIALGVRLKKSIKNSTLALPRHAGLVIRIFIFMSAFSLLMTLMARITAAKIIGATSVIGITMAGALVLFVELLMEAVYLQVEGNKHSSTFISFVDYQNVQSRLKVFLYLLATVAWLMLLARNLYIFDSIYEGVGAFLEKERKLGNTTFTYGSVIIFLLVIWVATVVAQVIAYMFGDTGPTTQPGKKNKLGSAMLLVRLAVLALGVLLAFAASGIPMDKVAIVIGALGVGIGFGLQNIVNNLVSGIILAFEKPIEVGDVIELGTRSGIVKEIGIRSSKISAYDGSEVIVPNGDLISQQLINWTLSDRTRRVEMIIGVAYGSDVKQVMEILKAAMRNREGILENPEPLVFLYQFADNAINFRVFFWISDLGLAGPLQSDIMTTVYEEFRKANIDIPYPQRDVHIKVSDLEILKQPPGSKPEA